jgi:hypothetical protein
MATIPFRNGHRTTDGTYTIAVCAQQPNLLAIYYFEEVLDLLVRRGLAIVLLGDRGVGLRVDLMFCEFLGHFEGCGD